MKDAIDSLILLLVGNLVMTPMIDALVRESQAGTPLLKATDLLARSLSPADVAAASEYAQEHQDRTAYHLLFALRRHAPDAYRQIPAVARAKVLADALGRLTLLNDWGHLDPAGSHDGEAAAALLELGDVAVPLLRPMLDDDRPAPLFGSEPATLSHAYGYRRKDFAYRYVMRLLGEQPSFEAAVQARDGLIDSLKARLAQRR